MCDLFRRSLLVLIICLSMIPIPARAGSVGSEGALTAPSANPTVNDPIPGAATMPLNQALELKPSDLTQVDNAVIPADNTGQTAKESPPPPRNETITVVHEDEEGRSANIALVIAFGISLALNIYLVTTLIARRKGYR